MVMKRFIDFFLAVIQAGQARFLEAAPVEVVFDNLLEHLLHSTESGYGFIGEVYHQDGAAFLRTRSTTDTA